MSKCETNSYGTKRYFNDNGDLHREDGPAIEWNDGDRSWYFNGQLHRLDGPAIEYAGDQQWYYYDKKMECYSQEEFLRLIKMKVFW